jgi:hypothetical protein
MLKVKCPEVYPRDTCRMCKQGAYKQYAQDTFYGYVRCTCVRMKGSYPMIPSYLARPYTGRDEGIVELTEQGKSLRQSSDFYSVNEYAKYFNVNPKTIYRRLIWTTTFYNDE